MPRGSGPNAPRLDPVAQPRVIVARFTATLERASVANCFAVTLQSRKCHQEGKRAWRESLVRAEPEEEAALDPERSDRRYRPRKMGRFRKSEREPAGRKPRSAGGSAPQAAAVPRAQSRKPGCRRPRQALVRIAGLSANPERQTARMHPTRRRAAAPGARDGQGKQTVDRMRNQQRSAGAVHQRQPLLPVALSQNGWLVGRTIFKN